MNRVVLAVDDELERLTADPTAPKPADGAEDDVSQLRLLSEYLKVSVMLWHAAEAVFFTPSQVPSSPALRQWVAAHFQEPADDEEATHLAHALKAVPPSTPPPPAVVKALWEHVTRAVVHGRILDATAALTLYCTVGGPRADATAVSLLAVLKAYPSDVAPTTEAATVFQASWREWHSIAVQAMTKLSVPPRSSDDPAAVLLGLVAGDVDLITSLGGGQWNFWFHHLNVKLLYGVDHAAVRKSGIRRLVAQCMAECDQNQDDPLYAAMLSTMDGNPAAAVSIMVSMNQLCTAVHLADLLWQAGHLDMADKLPTWRAPYRDHLMLEYASYAGSQDGMWRLAVAYAVAVDAPPGMLLAEEVLSRVPPSTEALAHKLVMTAELVGLAPLAARIAKVRGQDCLRRRQYGSATLWLSRAKDPALLRLLASKLLDVLCDTPSQASLDAVGAALASAHDTDAFALSPMLQFVALYHDFVDALHRASAALTAAVAPPSAGSPVPGDRDISALLHTAALRVHEMVAKAAAPRRFWAQVLLAAQAAGLWDVQPCVLSVAHLQQLQLAFEDLASVHHRAEEYLADVSKDDVASIRRGLATALAAAVVDAASTH